MKKKTKRDVLFLCQYFYPENNSSATLPFDTACKLAEAGFAVSALCGRPKEYASEQNVPARETTQGVKIHRLRYLQADRKSRLGLLTNFFSFTLHVFLHLHEVCAHRLVIVYSNPPVLPLAAAIADRCFGTKFIFVVYDVYPEIALQLGSIRKHGVIDRGMNYINRQVYRRASAVVALSEEMRQALFMLHPELESGRIAVLPNWAHESGTDRSRSAGEILTVGYFGNLGVAQDVDTLLAAMEQLRDDKRIRFLIVGHGSSFELVQQRAKQLPNVHIERFLTGDKLEQALSLCDCCVVSLREGLRGLCMPSKYYSYLQAGTAIVSIMEPDCELSREVEAQNLGAAVAPGDVEGLCAALQTMAEQLPAVHSAGARAAALYRARYQRDQTLDRYTALVRSVLEDT